MAVRAVSGTVPNCNGYFWAALGGFGNAPRGAGHVDDRRGRQLPPSRNTASLRGARRDPRDLRRRPRRAGILARRLGREPQDHTALDLAILSAATFKTARTLSRDDVASGLRAPFVEGAEPVETGDLRQAIGELVTCSRCVGTWAAAGLATTQIVASRFGRLLAWTLAAAGANDFLLAGVAAVTRKANG